MPPVPRCFLCPGHRFRMTDPLIAAHGLVLARDGQTILDGVDIHVNAGEIVTLVGPNGAGKTTLVRVLIGLVPPDSGTVTRRGGLTLGYVPQKLHLDPVLPLTVRRLMTLTHRAKPRHVAAALEEVGALHLIDKSMVELSGGETQRVLLARALVRDPDLLVLDEPTQGVDQSGQAEIYELIRRVRDRHRCAVLMISHDLHVVMAATDRVICLQRHVCCHGEPRAVAGNPEYRRLFGDLAAEVAIYRHHHDHDHDLHGNPVPPHDAATCHDPTHGHVPQTEGDAR